MFDPLFRFLSRCSRPAARVKPKQRTVPRLEALEDRWVPSTINTLSLQALLGGSLGGITGTPVAGGAQTPSINAPASTNNPTAPVQTPTTPTPGTPQTQEADATFTPFQTGGSQAQTVAQFNPSLGTLTGIQIISNGTLTSDIKVENLDGASSNVSAQVNGALSLQGPGFHPLVVNPSLTGNTTLSASDGHTDFTGTAGHDFGAQSAQASQSVNLAASENDLSAWIGGGTVSLTESAQSSSTLSGSGNLMSQINTMAAGTVRVIYSYTPTPNTPPPPPVSPPPPPPMTNCAPPTNPGDLTGFVYIDANHSGQRDTGDPGVPGVTVNLTGTTLTGQSVGLTTQSGSDGSYSFTNLQPGVYMLSEVQPPGFTPGSENLGSLGGVVVGNQMIVALPQGGDGHCYNFGEVLPPPPPPPPSVTPNGPGTPIPTPNANTPTSPPVDPLALLPGPLSKRSLIGNGFRSLG